MSSLLPEWLDHDLVVVLRWLYLLAATAIITIRLIPPLKNRFLDYGARSKASVHTHDAGLSSLLNRLAVIQVSHSRFKDFYLTSVFCSICWLMQQLFDGRPLQHVQQMSTTKLHDKSTPAIKTVLSLLLVTTQGLRRLHESVNINRHSNSKMWIGHYVLGLLFYISINIAVIVEHEHPDHSADRIGNGLNFSGSPLDIIALALFLIASLRQHLCHAYLASLPKYTLPEKAEFRWIVAPHYTAECFIYLALAVLSAPAGKRLNYTVMSALVFVTVNLGLTADSTKSWMMEKFKERRTEIVRRWRILPLIW